jgi:sortase A
MLAYCGFVLIDTTIYQRNERRHLDRLLTDRQKEKGRAHQTASLASPKISPPDRGPLALGSLLGRIDVRRLGVSVIVMEGIGRSTLRRAVGHIPGTALPGQAGNVGISGHRDTFFRPLRNIHTNDIITITTTLGEYRYRVVSTKVVGPYDVAVLNPGANEILTLVTCYPFYFVGAAPDRFIVRAERVT